MRIVLDCRPGALRPDALLPRVIEGTGVKIDPNKTSSRLFGEWVWQIPKKQEKAFVAALPTIKKRIINLHKQGLIRYGEWSQEAT